MKKYSAVGIDVSDKDVKVIGIDDDGKVALRKTIVCEKGAVKRTFDAICPTIVALETGGHTGWLARTLAEMGHDVVVANARKVKAIWADERKSDWRDAETLARLARTDRELLRPVTLRSEACQRDLNVFKARDALVSVRTKLVCTVRSLVKGLGRRIPKCSTDAFVRRCREELTNSELEVLEGILRSVENLSEQIMVYDRQIDQIAGLRYAESVGRLTAVKGVGTLTALAFVLNMEKPDRFVPRRQVGAYLGMTPRRDQSGQSEKQLGITHAGNEMMRRLLVSCAHYILGPFGPDTDLRRFGLRLMTRGGKNAKKRAVVAVARKLAVLLVRLWQTGEAYEPLHNEQRIQKVA